MVIVFASFKLIKFLSSNSVIIWRTVLCNHWNSFDWKVHKTKRGNSCRVLVFEERLTSYPIGSSFLLDFGFQQYCFFFLSYKHCISFWLICLNLHLGRGGREGGLKNSSDWRHNPRRTNHWLSYNFKTHDWAQLKLNVRFLWLKLRVPLNTLSPKPLLDCLSTNLYYSHDDKKLRTMKDCCIVPLLRIFNYHGHEMWLCVLIWLRRVMNSIFYGYNIRTVICKHSIHIFCIFQVVCV